MAYELLKKAEEHAVGNSNMCVETKSMPRTNQQENWGATKV